MNSTDRADALARPSGFSSVNPLPGGGAPIERRQIPPRPHLIHSDDLLRLQRGELLGVGRPLPLDTFLLLFGVVESLFFSSQIQPPQCSVHRGFTDLASESPLIPLT